MALTKIAADGGTTFSTTGGKGSVSYNLNEISLAGSKFLKLSDRMSDLVSQLNMVARTLSEAAFPIAYYPNAALDQLGNAHLTGLVTQGAIARLARDTQAAVSNYAAAENAAAAKARQISSAQALTAGYSFSHLGPLASFKLGAETLAWYLRAKENGYRNATEQALNNITPFFFGLMGSAGVGAYVMTGGLRAAKPATGLGAVLTVRYVADCLGINTPGDLSTRRVPPSEWAGKVDDWRPGQVQADPSGGTPVQVETSLAGILQGSQDAYSYPPGSIVVDRLQRADGTNAWIVHLPGTQDWSQPDSQNPFDLEGDLEGMTSVHAGAFKQHQILIQELMRLALADAGALPSDETLITGHSGGGIHAAAAAASPVFLAHVNVKMIAIAGASGGALPVKSGIDVVDLQNENDVVTAADYKKSPDTAHWVTITSHRPSSTEGKGLVQVVAQAHDLGNYIQDAKDMENSKDPAIVGSQQALASFFSGAAVVGLAGTVGAGSLTVKRTVYQGVDTNRYPPKAEPTKATPPSDIRPAIGGR